MVAVNVLLAQQLVLVPLVCLEVMEAMDIILIIHIEVEMRLVVLGFRPH